MLPRKSYPGNVYYENLTEISTQLKFLRLVRCKKYLCRKWEKCEHYFLCFSRFYKRFSDVLSDLAKVLPVLFWLISRDYDKQN